MYVSICAQAMFVGRHAHQTGAALPAPVRGAGLRCPGVRCYQAPVAWRPAGLGKLCCPGGPYPGGAAHRCRPHQQWSASLSSACSFKWLEGNTHACIATPWQVFPPAIKHLHSVMGTAAAQAVLLQMAAGLAAPQLPLQSPGLACQVA